MTDWLSASMFPVCILHKAGIYDVNMTTFLHSLISLLNTAVFMLVEFTLSFLCFKILGCQMHLNIKVPKLYWFIILFLKEWVWHAIFLTTYFSVDPHIQDMTLKFAILCYEKIATQKWTIWGHVAKCPNYQWYHQK